MKAKSNLFLYLCMGVILGVPCALTFLAPRIIVHAWQEAVHGKAESTRYLTIESWPPLAVLSLLAPYPAIQHPM